MRVKMKDLGESQKSPEAQTYYNLIRLFPEQMSWMALNNLPKLLQVGYLKRASRSNFLEENTVILQY